LYSNPEDSVLSLKLFSKSADGNSIIYCYTDRDKSEFRKIDLAGNTIFEIPVNVSQGTNNHLIAGLNSTPDSGLIFADNSFISLSGNSYSHLKKYNKNGILEWSAEVPKIQNSSGYEQQTYDVAIIPGGYAALAIDSLYFFNDSGILIKTRNTSGPGKITGLSNGDLLITNQQYRGRVDTMLNMIYPLQAGNIYFADTFLYRVNGDTLYKINFQTGITSSSLYIPDASLYSYSILQDGGWIAYHDKTINCYDPNGNLKWSNYAQLSHYSLDGLGEQSDGTIMYGGTYLSAEVPNDVDYSFFISTIDSSGRSISDSTTQVYPGDADDDSVLEFSDIVYVALAQGNSGRPRIDTSLINSSLYMVGDIAVDFESSFSIGVNHKQCDVVPDGRIDSLDIEYLGIFGLAYNNLSTHFRTTRSIQSDSNAISAIYSFSCLPEKDTASIGDTIRFYFILGEDGNYLDSIFGIACNLTFDSLPMISTYAARRVNITMIDSDLSSVSNQQFWTYFPWAFHLSFLMARKDLQNAFHVKDTIGYADVRIDDIYSSNTELRIRCMDMKAITAGGFPVDLQYNSKPVYLRSSLTSTNATSFENIHIYPNPVQDHIILKHLPEKNISIHVYDLYGRDCLNTMSLNKSEIKIETFTFAEGAYLLELKTDEKTIFTGRFLKH
jgi:hypothetical protein